MTSSPPGGSHNWYFLRPGVSLTEEKLRLRIGARPSSLGICNNHLTVSRSVLHERGLKIRASPPSHPHSITSVVVFEGWNKNAASLAGLNNCWSRPREQREAEAQKNLKEATQDAPYLDNA